MRALADAYAQVFGTVFAFRAAREEERPGYGSFRAHVMSALSDAKSHVERDRLDPRDYAHYAVVALVDETVMTSEWAGAEQWRSEPLQMHYFGDLLGGEKFFDRLSDLSSGADDDLLEVYFVCLCAGFRGKFYDDAGELDRRRRKLHQQLRVVDLRDERHLTDEAYDRPLERSLTRTYFPWWAVLPFALGVLTLYVGLQVVLRWQVDDIVTKSALG
jgi:type VI secretion system protein ImpK